MLKCYSSHFITVNILSQTKNGMWLIVELTPYPRCCLYVGAWCSPPHKCNCKSQRSAKECDWSSWKHCTFWLVLHSLAAVLTLGIVTCSFHSQPATITCVCSPSWPASCCFLGLYKTSTASLHCKCWNAKTKSFKQGLYGGSALPADTPPVHSL